MEENKIIIYNTDDGKNSVKLFAKDGTIWLNQQLMAELFDTSKQSISYHISNILKEKELDGFSVVKEFLTTAPDGKNYNVTFYSLEMVLAVGFRVRNKHDVLSNNQMEEFVDKVYAEFNEKRKKYELAQADKEDLEELKQIENEIKSKK